MQSNIIKVEAKHAYTMFPKRPTVLGVGDDTYGIVAWTITEVIEGEPKADDFNDEIVVTGYYEEEIESSKNYTILAKEVEHEKYGTQYQLLFIGEVIDLTSVGNQKAFLKTFLSDGQIEEMFKVLSNPLKSIADHNVDELKKVHGIGDYISERIIERFEENKDYCNVYLELDGYGLTPKFIQRLIKKYSNPNIIIDIVKNNPYQLSYDIEGIGFKTADKIALNSGMSPCSKERIKAFINYLLNELAEVGDSYILASELNDYIFDNLGSKDEILEFYYNDDGDIIGNNIGTAIDELAQSNKLVIEQENEYISKSERRVYLTKYYNLEKDIANHLKRLTEGENDFEFGDWQAVVKQQENQQGWQFTEQQIDGIKACLENQVVFITGGAGCVDCDTEYFNGVEWKKISDYRLGDKTLQYNKDGTATLTNPLQYHKYKSEYLWHFKTKYGINQCLSDEHNVYYMTSKNNLFHKTFKEVRENHEKTSFKGKFITTFSFEGNGLPYNEWQLRLMVAIKADGSFKDYKYPNTCYINVKKQRKKDRVELLLNKNKILYEVINRDNGYSMYKFDCFDNEKTYTTKWYNCSKEQYKIIHDEIFHWDGRYKKRNEYFTTIKTDADFIQFVGTALGYRCSIQEYDRRGREQTKNGKLYITNSKDYTVVFSKNTLVSLCRDKRSDHVKTPINKYKTIDGYKYCFTVPSGMLVLRRKDNIFITGNSGKTSVLGGALQALRCYEGKYSFAQTSLSGKAAARMQEITGQDGSTIHRLLGYDPLTGGFICNRDNKLQHDIIIVDEISLIGGEIFLSLIEAIKTGSKLIVLGDMGQLESIGCLNLAQDLYSAEYINTVELTKIHRQAQKSGIILASQAIRNGNPIFETGYNGELTIGELEDMHFDVHAKKDGIRESAMNHFIEYWMSDNVSDIMDIQVLAPVKERGEASVKNLNDDIQKYVNPYSKLKKQIKVTNEKENVFLLREGDKVMNIKNNYKILNIYGMVTPVFNGWTGILTEVDDNEGKATVHFPIINESVIFNFSELRKHIVLGYASTIHKMQGSQAKIIIGVLDYSTPPSMRTKELAYTLVTRAEKECVFIVQNKALNDAIRTSGVSNKNTFLREMLDGIY